MEAADPTPPPPEAAPAAPAPSEAAAELRLRRLLPVPGDVSPVQAVAGLRLADLAPPERPYLVLNMVASADGKATLAGRTAGLGERADRELFHALRTQVDAVLVGAETVRVERYGRLVREPVRREQRRAEGLAPDPLAVVVSGALALPADLPLLQAPEQRVVVLTTTASGEPPDVPAPVEVVRGEPDDEGRLPLAPVLRRLREQLGVRSILCEGGPLLNAYLLREGLVDELFLCLAPKLLGGDDAATIVTGEPLSEPAGLDLVGLLEHDDHLFLRMRVRR